MKSQIEKATLGAGCFWCIEAIYQHLNGVIAVKSGYSGGRIKNPAYPEVCEGRTGHAEVCEIKYDTSILSFEDILDVFWRIHDPTTLNRQGNNIGSQYRSAIYYRGENQKHIAEQSKLKCNQSKIYKNPIVTEITALENFYPAEDYHNSYYELHKEEPYCKLVTLPKLEKFKLNFPSKLKKAED